MLKTSNVLLLSEDHKVRELIARALKEHGCELIHKGHMQPAASALNEGEFNAVIIDLENYRPDPFSEIREARASKDTLDIIALGNTEDAKKMVDAIKAGADEYLWKPVNPEQAVLVLSRLTERRMLKELAREAELYKRMANTDELTGLYNYRFFHSRLDAEIARASRLKRNICLIMIDIDDFKGYNDMYGHMAGDAILKKMAELLIRHSRIYDTVTRYGGEEFAIIAPDSPKAAAKVFGDRIRKKVEAFQFEGEKKLPGGKLTVSAGIASYPDDASNKTELLNRADQSLYEAKRLGRNRIVMWNGNP